MGKRSRRKKPAPRGGGAVESNQPLVAGLPESVPEQFVWGFFASREMLPPLSPQLGRQGRRTVVFVSFS